MNEEQNVNTSPKPKKKRSFWWLKLLLILILVAAGVIGGIMLSSQAITQQLLREFLPQYAASSTEENSPIEIPAPTPKAEEDEPIVFIPAVTASPVPQPSKSPVEIISPEAEEKAKDEAEPAESSAPEAEEAPEASPAPETEESPLPEALPAFAPVTETPAPELPEQPAENKAAEPIGIDAALEAALDHAKLDISTVVVYGVSREKDDGVLYYEVEFLHGMQEYEYEINAYTGAVESWKTVREKNIAPAAAVQAAVAETEYISLADAKEAALSHAGYREHETTDMKAELEIDRNKVVYDVEFWAEGYDYEYKVDAVSGLIIMVEKDRG